MAGTVRKYNPGFLTDEDLVASFCVRVHEYETIVEMLRECTGSSNPHQIVIGPRGSGKTSLLLRIAAEVHRDAELSRDFFPVVFAEESYEVATAGEFWLECLSRLADQAPTREGGPDLRRSFEDLRTIRDDRTLGDRCLGTLMDYSAREGKRLVLMVENLNMMFRDMMDSGDAGWRMRKILQTEPRIVLLASATRRFDEIDHPEHALYDQLRVVTLNPLDTNECAVLWEKVAGRCPTPETIRSLEILTGGSPRLLAIVARFGVGRSFRELMADLLDLVDDHTEYFKSHIESLPAQERRVYLALADLWKPANTREIADRTRLDTNRCSAQLTRLVDRGVVHVAGGSARRKQYYLTERLYNIYYLMRRSRGPDSLIEAIIQFMVAYYSPRELRDIGVHLTREDDLDNEDALASFDEVILRFAEHDATALLVPAAAAFLAKGRVLVALDRRDEALIAFDEVASRAGESETPFVLHLSAAAALFYKGVTLGDSNRREEALVAYDEALGRLKECDTLIVSEFAAMILVNRGGTLALLNRHEEALAASEDAIRRFGESENSILSEPVARALFNKGAALHRLDRYEEAIAAYDVMVCRFGTSDASSLREMVAAAVFWKGTMLDALNRPEEAMAACEEVVDQFGASDAPAFSEWTAKALLKKGDILRKLNRPEDALDAFDDVTQRFGTSDVPALLAPVANAFIGEGFVLHGMNRLEEAVAAFDKAVRWLGENDMQPCAELAASAHAFKGRSLAALNRPEEALAAHDAAARRFKALEHPALGALAEQLFLEKAEIEHRCGRHETAIETAGRAMEQLATVSSEARLRGHLIRVRATLASGDPSRGEPDIEAILAILPELGALPKDVLHALMAFSTAIGPERMSACIRTSPSASLLLPLTTALERDLGLEPRVAREVEEIAQDIRRDLAKLKEPRGDTRWHAIP